MRYQERQAGHGKPIRRVKSRPQTLAINTPDFPTRDCGESPHRHSFAFERVAVASGCKDIALVATQPARPVVLLAFIQPSFP